MANRKMNRVFSRGSSVKIFPTREYSRVRRSGGRRSERIVAILSLSRKSNFCLESFSRMLVAFIPKRGSATKRMRSENPN